MSDREVYTHPIVDWVLVGTGLAIVVAAVAIILSVLPAHAAKRQHVVIHKQPPAPAQQPAAVPIAVIPVAGLFYDIARRTDCRGDVLGLGGAGFDPKGPRTGNFLIPAIYRSKCQAAPKGGY